MNTIVRKLKENNEDYEWYPTTQPMIDAINKHLDIVFPYHHTRNDKGILDCGAGDGRVLEGLDIPNKYAIEKSQTLIDLMNHDIMVIGTDFEAQNLIDKKIEVTFSNPPYSQYREWMIKIINETRSGHLYFIVPARWKNDEQIRAAICERIDPTRYNAKVQVIYSTNFDQCERATRHQVNVDIVAIDMSGRDKLSQTDPFDKWFNEQFDFDKAPDPFAATPTETGGVPSVETDLVNALHNSYNDEMDRFLQVYRALEKLPKSLIGELAGSIKNVSNSLHVKITDLKDHYWRKLFDNLDRVTDRLTSKTRKDMLERLYSATSVDFTLSNIHTTLLWVIKNANKYYDSQLCSLYEKMVYKANLKPYKSNERTFENENWLYSGRAGEGVTRYMLDYRVVLSNMGGLDLNWRGDSTGELSSTARNFIKDVWTIAKNLGYDAHTDKKPEHLEWQSGKAHDFYYRDHTKDEDFVLFSIKAFKNGNVHIKFNSRFIMKLNVEFGRLKGWLKDKQQASEELNIKMSDIESMFNGNLKLANNSLLLLTNG